MLLQTEGVIVGHLPGLELVLVLVLILFDFRVNDAAAALNRTVLSDFRSLKHEDEDEELHVFI